MPDLWSLRILVTVAEHGSFSAGAEALVLTQPAVSRQIAGLEREVGVRLFRRVPRGVALTPAGAVAVDLARGVLARVDAFSATMRTYAGLDRDVGAVRGHMGDPVRSAFVGRRRADPQHGPGLAGLSAADAAPARPTRLGSSRMADAGGSADGRPPGGDQAAGPETPP